jgi:hypothetical protein
MAGILRVSRARLEVGVAGMGVRVGLGRGVAVRAGLGVTVDEGVGEGSSVGSRTTTVGLRVGDGTGEGVFWSPTTLSVATGWRLI